MSSKAQHCRRKPYYWKALVRSFDIQAPAAIKERHWNQLRTWDFCILEAQKERERERSFLKSSKDCPCVLSHFIHIWLFATLWTVAYQAALSMGILQARILEWVAVPSSGGSSRPRDQTLGRSSIRRQALYHWHHLGSPKKEKKVSVLTSYVCVLSNFSVWLFDPRDSSP